MYFGNGDLFSKFNLSVTKFFYLKVIGTKLLDISAKEDPLFFRGGI